MKLQKIYINIIQPKLQLKNDEEQTEMQFDSITVRCGQR